VDTETVVVPPLAGLAWPSSWGVQRYFAPRRRVVSASLPAGIAAARKYTLRGESPPRPAIYHKRTPGAGVYGSAAVAPRRRDATRPGRAGGDLLVVLWHCGGAVASRRGRVARAVGVRGRS
jgi:hypothetical protein